MIHHGNSCCGMPHNARKSLHRTGWCLQALATLCCHQCVSITVCGLSALGDGLRADAACWSSQILAPTDKSRKRPDGANSCNKSAKPPILQGLHARRSRRSMS